MNPPSLLLARGQRAFVWLSLHCLFLSQLPPLQCDIQTFAGLGQLMTRDAPVIEEDSLLLELQAKTTHIEF